MEERKLGWKAIGDFAAEISPRQISQGVFADGNFDSLSLEEETSPWEVKRLKFSPHGSFNAGNFAVRNYAAKKYATE